MKRRNFIKQSGLGFSAAVIGRQALNDGDQRLSFEDYKYPDVESLQDILSKDNQVILRLAFQPAEGKRQAHHKGKLKINGADIHKIKEFFFEKEEDYFNTGKNEWNISSTSELSDILVVWLDRTSEKTLITITNNSDKFSLSLGELIKRGEVLAFPDDEPVTINYLLDKEIGELSPDELLFKDPGEDFSFIVLADPQGGDPTHPENNAVRMKIHNAFAEESIRLVNELEDQPLYAMILGDIVDSQGQTENFRVMNDYLSRLKSPVLYELGNHETRYRAVFTPGYNMDAFSNYFAAQKEINGIDKLLYSFNAGKWHFVVWPDPLRTNFWETHPHYFDWLEQDLEKYMDRPTLIFQHVPVHPPGINPFESYLESPYVKRTFLEIISKNGNVKTVLSGHAHSPVKASFKTAVSYKGINLITLPAAGYRPRGFGEEDYFGGPSQGFLIGKVEGEAMKLKYKTVTEEVFEFPDKFPEFKSGDYPLWLNYKWEMRGGNGLKNSDFKNGLDGWARPYIYQEDKEPSNICEVREAGPGGDSNSLFMYSRKRGYDAPGQDRLPQTMNSICQVISFQDGTFPVIKLNYKIDGSTSMTDGLCGGYIWIEGFAQSRKYINLMYWANKAYVNLGGKYSQNRFAEPMHITLPMNPDGWQAIQINAADDFNRYSKDLKFNDLDLDRLVLNFGVWTLNDGRDHSFGMYYNNPQLFFESIAPDWNTNVDGQEVSETALADKWWLGKLISFTRVGGEHRYHLETVDLLNKPK